jgi:ABC-type arginine transport system permease subunit
MQMGIVILCIALAALMLWAVITTFRKRGARYVWRAFTDELKGLGITMLVLGIFFGAVYGIGAFVNFIWSLFA